MFTFHWSELLVVVIGGLILFFGLALLMLRRRNEILEKFLTPEEPDLEENFFRVHKPSQEESSTEEMTAEETEEEESPDGETARWGNLENAAPLNQKLT